MKAAAMHGPGRICNVAVDDAITNEDRDIVLEVTGRLFVAPISRWMVSNAFFVRMTCRVMMKTVVQRMMGQRRN